MPVLAPKDNRPIVHLTKEEAYKKYSKAYKKKKRRRDNFIYYSFLLFIILFLIIVFILKYMNYISF